jgi:DNA-binding MarR family transcriptional regulator
VILARAAERLLADYPRIFLACHRRHVRDDASGAVVSAHQVGILEHLDTVEPTTLTDLARHVGVTAATMSVTVDRLARAGYVVRSPDAVDRRRVQLRLTESGERVRSANSVLDPARVRDLLERLDGPERAAAIRGLALLARAADALGAADHSHRAGSRTA